MTDSFDVSFSVPFTQRLRFTDDVLGADTTVLTDLIERPSKVLAVVESSIRIDRLPADDVLVVDGGESIKNSVGRLTPIMEKIRDNDLDRRSYVIAVGGGALLDAVGFAAAIAHRGIRLIRIPTTTLSQADSGIGVKNAINFFGRKNWVGTFAVPWGVVNDRGLLSTLPDRDWRAGFVEAVKVALLKDADFFDRLCETAKAIAARDWSAAGPAIRRSALLHLDHITKGGDPFETREARPLDFGHWSAHRLEQLTNFTVRHGEAVAIGLAVDCRYAVEKLGLPPSVLDRVLSCLTDLGLPTSHPALADGDAIVGGLEEFRQHLGGRLTLTMIADVGRPIDVHEVDAAAMRRAVSNP